MSRYSAGYGGILRLFAEFNSAVSKAVYLVYVATRYGYKSVFFCITECFGIFTLSVVLVEGFYPFKQGGVRLNVGFVNIASISERMCLENDSAKGMKQVDFALKGKF